VNGKTHQISGIAATLSVTAVTLENQVWLAQHLPSWLLPIFTPPPALLRAAHTFSEFEGAGISKAVVSKYAETPSGLSVAGIERGITGFTQYAVDSGAVVLTLLGIALLGLIVGQLPDLDTPYSTISNGGEAVAHLIKGSGFFRVIVRFIFDVFNIIPHLFSLFANHYMGGHRNGIIHGLLGWWGSSAAFTWFCWAVFGVPFYGLLFFVAYFVHLVVDSFSHSGVKWFWPLSNTFYHLLPKKLSFYTANPVHNAITQVACVIITGAATYSLVLKLGRSGEERQGGAIVVEDAALVLIVLVSLLLIIGMIVAAKANWKKFKSQRSPQRGHYNYSK
jgi:membrane-bound metal-dependent hydrolase YbcI (DUF457 family)